MIINRLFINKSYIISRFSVRRHKSYSHTVLLPKTDFPLRLKNEKLRERDRITSEVVNSNVYDWQRQNLSDPEFILHDGPPYANGTPHMGHAMNKILKDIILRFKMLEGRKVHYIPGWDCHGLPIELKALKNKSINQNPLEIRCKARDFAKEAIEIQKKMFISWGVIGDWNNAYTSYSVDYIKNELKKFYELYSKQLIHRDVKPIYWSPSTKTALAESELEYNPNHKSLSLYLRCEVEEITFTQFPIKKPIYALIWTTTPWTLPSNQAVCFNPNLTYCLCTKDSGQTIHIVAIETIDELKKNFNCDIEILAVLPDGTLSEAKYRHPIYKDKILSFLVGSHVDAVKGTGLVHTAPAHGHDDFLVALKNDMSIIDLVDDDGCYTQEAGPDLAGKFVLTEGNEAIIKLIKDNVIHLSELTHSYPYDWRTKTPVVVKASAQWFLNSNALKNKAIESLNNVAFVPNSKGAIYKKEFLKQIEKRPFWCISRQRKWGVHIPVFYEKDTEEVVLNEEIMNHQYKLLDEYGVDYWWQLSEDKLLPGHMDSAKFKKGEDILDIWFDSGISWSKVLNGERSADIYLEGGDQLNGWFYSSLITSLALRNVLPYKTLYIHGFAVDEKGLKMSKSLGNIINPVDVVEGSKSKKPYGIDVLRWWVSCHANQNSLVYVSENVLQSCSDEVQKIRNVLRFALASISDYEYVKYENNCLSFIDAYMLHILYQFKEEIREDIDNYEFHKLGKKVINIVTNEISAFYYTCIKDRLYCNTKDSASRKCAQFVLYHIFETISQAVAPILPHLVEELYSYLPTKRGKTYFTSFHEKIQQNWKNDDVQQIMDVILDIRKNFNLQIGTGTNVMDVNIIFSEHIFDKIQSMGSVQNFQYDIANILQCAEVGITCDANELREYQLSIAESKRFQCPRCRRRQSNENDELCQRCSEVLNNQEFINTKNVLV
ncbi:hypothetical protein WA026_013778 [Henosepilachna vigintioctopunctata]|uniref:isoleucine--tRNA ligase n=1 Tax=Henosepilachna vigintioctopunctata TaxID=420089 RepID=A0AAW1URZ5_9CUCU